MLVARLSPDGREIEELVGGGLRGADRGERTWVVQLARPGATYVVIPLCLCNNPSAAESTQRQPFSLRLWTSEPVLISHVASYPPPEAAARHRIDWSSAVALQALHCALFSPPASAAASARPRGFGRAAQLERQPFARAAQLPHAHPNAQSSPRSHWHN